MNASRSSKPGLQSFSGLLTSPIAHGGHRKRFGSAWPREGGWLGNLFPKRPRSAVPRKGFCVKEKPTRERLERKREFRSPNHAGSPPQKNRGSRTPDFTCAKFGETFRKLEQKETALLKLPKTRNVQSLEDYRSHDTRKPVTELSRGGFFFPDRLHHLRNERGGFQLSLHTPSPPINKPNANQVRFIELSAILGLLPILTRRVVGKQASPPSRNKLPRSDL